MKYNTIDNYTYYQREASNKAQQIFGFVKENGNIKTVFDVGCNNGNMSCNLPADVYGIDASDNLHIPEGYKFDVVDITQSPKVYYVNDLTLFLSLYHHLLGAYDLKTADDVFFKLLAQCKYLIFDTGNLTEVDRVDQPWYLAQKKIFNTAEDLYNHFKVDYKVLGSWNVAGGKRKLLLFEGE